MKKYLFFKESNLMLINFEVLFSTIETDCLNDLQEYGLIENYQIDLSKKDTKKIIYHHIIHGICEEVRNNKHKHHKVIVAPTVFLSNHQITQFCNPEEFEILMKLLFKRLKNSLPFIIYSTKDEVFEEDVKSGEMIDLVAILSSLCNNLSNKRFTFEKVKKFSRQFDLNFLSNEYFDSIKTKLLLH